MDYTTGTLHEAQIRIRSGAVLKNLRDATTRTLKTDLVCQAYYRESFDLWRYAWIQDNQEVWRVEREDLTILQETKTHQTPPCPKPKQNPLPSPRTQQPDNPDDTTLEIFKTFLKINRVR